MKLAIALVLSLLAACGSDTGDVQDSNCSPTVSAISPRCVPAGAPTPQHYGPLRE